MINLKGMYIRGAIWDGAFIYLVEANRRIFTISTNEDCDGPGNTCSPAWIVSVRNAKALYECRVQEVIDKLPTTIHMGTYKLFEKVFEISTTKGICFVTVRSDDTNINFWLESREYKGEPQADFRKLCDF